MGRAAVTPAADSRGVSLTTPSVGRTIGGAGVAGEPYRRRHRRPRRRRRSPVRGSQIRVRPGCSGVLTHLGSSHGPRGHVAHAQSESERCDSVRDVIGRIMGVPTNTHIQLLYIVPSLRE